MKNPRDQFNYCIAETGAPHWRLAIGEHRPLRSIIISILPGSDKPVPPAAHWGNVYSIAALSPPAATE